MVEFIVAQFKKERAVIQGAPFSFATACVISLVVCYGLFSAALALRKETVEAYKERYGELASAPQKQSLVSYQVLDFDGGDPNAERLKPQNTNGPALAYSHKTGVLFQWDSKAQLWK